MSVSQVCWHLNPLGTVQSRSLMPVAGIEGHILGSAWGCAYALFTSSLSEKPALLHYIFLLNFSQSFSNTVIRFKLGTENYQNSPYNPYFATVPFLLTFLIKPWLLNAHFLYFEHQHPLSFVLEAALSLPIPCICMLLDPVLAPVWRISQRRSQLQGPWWLFSAPVSTWPP